MITLLSLLKWVVLFALVKAGIIEKSTVEKVAKGTFKVVKSALLISFSAIFAFENQAFAYQYSQVERKQKEQTLSSD
ncbi:hypothetical protein VINI7043_27710 [Vibrio nigripulchritudo ATCC 27043]|uniref:Uncharacterized protein n=2 Tax=Vibrio nigripulchritudo TaxID=28173 RepID=U4KHI7_9VIBR|nr:MULTISPECIES: hypothetical protein [Vibrio]EGU51923.1 hypothetical protein VINI7043_27710 [Vibrio nigripulchritudo ATCC 27043]KJY75169.1 hypothetical protein TW74_17665 [Vibrio nigripulchritudo]UAB72748.1 hypothetical protein INR79_26210 [Vibrio sp. SCSIO 43132]CCN81966.1 hypothetical protein VIBNIBLFn1_300056 [Vibrio nigripulchritudo BLFn1]CCN90429.1 hypothetical protein VIBNISFn27_710073 [Vibrio nigripulchritudo SFn27]